MSMLSEILSIVPDINRFERIWKIAQVDFKRRYYNDRLGLIWALLNPIFIVLIYNFIFTIILKRVSEGIDNYALFLFSGIIIWMSFVEMIKKGMRIILSKKYLILNVKVKKEDLYFSSSISVLFSLIFNIVAFLVMALLYGFTFSLPILFLPVIIINVLLIGCGLGMILSIIFVHFRDFTHIIDLITMLGLWTSGIFFKADLILQHSPVIYYLNPFVGMIDNLRRITLYNLPPNLVTVNLNILIGLIIFIVGNVIIKNNFQSATEKI